MIGSHTMLFVVMNFLPQMLFSFICFSDLLMYDITAWSLGMLYYAQLLANSNLKNYIKFLNRIVTMSFASFPYQCCTLMIFSCENSCQIWNEWMSSSFLLLHFSYELRVSPVICIYKVAICYICFLMLPSTLVPIHIYVWRQDCFTHLPRYLHSQTFSPHDN